MQYRELGKTGIKVSAVGFGAWAIGGPSEASGAPLGWGRTTDEESLAAIRRARDLGVNFFDTADSYGFGRSESLLGIVLARLRQDVVLATKVGVVRTSSGELRKDFSRQHIFLAVDGSLKRLRTDYIDLYQVHNPTLDDLRREEIQEAMEMLQDAGKIRFWGVSISTPEEGLEIVQRERGHAAGRRGGEAARAAGRLQLLPAARRAAVTALFVLLLALATPDQWLQDFHQLLGEMASHYANLDSVIDDRKIDLPAVTKRAEDRIRAAKDGAEAQRAIEQFLSALGDGHVQIRW